MKNLFKLAIILLAATSILMACGSDDEETAPSSSDDGTAPMPTFSITCTTADASNCGVSSDGKVVKMAVMKSAYDCTDDFIDANFIAVTNDTDTVSCDGTTCEATITAVYDPTTEAEVTELDDGDTALSIISYIDNDADDEVGSGDAFVCIDDVDVTGTSADVSGTWQDLP